MITAQSLGHEYCAITDHSPRLTVARGLTAERLREQQKITKELDAAMAPFRALQGIEVDILEDGGLDQDDDLLAELDVVVASVHSKLRSDSETMTHRMVAAIANRAHQRPRSLHRPVDHRRAGHPAGVRVRRRGGVRGLPHLRRRGGDQLPAGTAGPTDPVAGAGDRDGLPVLDRHRCARSRAAGVPRVRLRAGRGARSRSAARDQHLAGGPRCCPGAGRAERATTLPPVDDAEVATSLVTEAGTLAARMLAEGLDTHYKTSVSDVVSAADHAAEELVVAAAERAPTRRWSRRRGGGGSAGGSDLVHRPRRRHLQLPLRPAVLVLGDRPRRCRRPGARRGLLPGARRALGRRPEPADHAERQDRGAADRRVAGPGVGGHLLPSSPPAGRAEGRHLALGRRCCGDGSDARIGLGGPGRGGQRPGRSVPAGQPASVGLVPGRCSGAGCRWDGGGVGAGRQPLADRRQRPGRRETADALRHAG